MNKALQDSLETEDSISVLFSAAKAELCDEILKLHQNMVVASNTSLDRPQFDFATGELTFRGKLIREYAKKAKNCFAVLVAFEASGWSRSIDDPLPGGKYAERLNNTVRSLNKRLSDIRFHAGGDGMSVRWKVGN